MKLLTLFILLWLASPDAGAEEVLPPECKLLAVQSPNNSDAAYQPGVDVHGKPVVPVDLNAGQPSALVPQTVVVPLSVDLAQRLQGHTVEGLQLEAPLGMLEIHPNGRVVYNGQDLTPQVYPLCGQYVPPGLPRPEPKPQPPVSAPSAGNGQAPADTIKSEAVEIAPAVAVPPGSVEIEGSESREEGYR